MQLDTKKSKVEISQHASPDVIGWLFVSALSVICYLYLSNVFAGQNLHVWGDEILYSIDSRRSNLSDSYYPNFLYLKLFSLTSYAGTGFLEVARSINAALVAGSVPFIYLICRRFCSRPVSVFVAALSVFGPISTYAAYFMPDAMYFSSFYVFAWVCLFMADRRCHVYGLTIGVLCAVLAYIKPHGLFVLLAFIFMQVVIFSCQRREGGFKDLCILTATSAVAFFVMHFLLGFLLTGKVGTGFIGGYSQFASVPWGMDQIASAAKLTLTLLRGHMLALALLVGVAILALLTKNGTGDSRSEDDFFRLKVFAISQLSLMFFITIAFSVRIADGAPFVDTMRVHMRYYNLFFPLLYIMAASFIASRATTTFVSRAAAVVLLAVVTSILFGGLDGLIPTELDAPELRGVTASHGVLMVVTALSIISLALFAFKPSYGAKAYIFLMLPITLLLGSYAVNSDLRGRLQDMQGDKAGKIVKTFLGTEAIGIGFFGDVVSICQAQFYAGDDDSFLYLLPEGMPVPEHLSPGLPVDGHLIPPGRLMPAGTKWIVVFGDHAVPSNYESVLSYPGWALYRTRS
ncbi:hypothetical protein [Pseudomonas chlororaphis]|uniref:hypothetical protein n=1 Tax=Pseudomonas chlororaphis TaxID=587753 RepID=UPI0039E4D772